jgi:hypothetical protein
MDPWLIVQEQSYAALYMVRLVAVSSSMRCNPIIKVQQSLRELSYKHTLMCNPAALNPGFLISLDTGISPVNVDHAGPPPWKRKKANGDIRN